MPFEMMSSRDMSITQHHPFAPVLSGHIPKYGTRIPNRIFVGGITADTTEMELRHFFAVYGPVKDCKIILDRGGVSKSYGFVTFENQDDADRILRKESENLIFKDRKLNIGQAVRKQQAFPKAYESSMSPGVNSLSSYPAPPGLQYHTLPNGSNGGFTLYCAPEGYILPATAPTTGTASPQQGLTFPMMVAPQTYNQQLGSTYYHQSPTCGAPTQWSTGGSPWRWGIQIPSGSSMMPGSPYLYPVHTAMLPQETVFATRLAALPEISSSSGSLIDQCPGEQYYHGTPQFAGSAMC